MGNRLSKITTRTGDDGTTGLAGAERVPKTSARIAAIGDVDELNAVIGVWRSVGLTKGIDASLESISQQLFNLGGELAMPGEALLDRSAVTSLDKEIERWNAELPPLREFILPGGPPPVAWAHMARTVCRRAERQIWQLAEDESVERLRPEPSQYLNRLSDLFFVLGRHIATSLECTEKQWEHERHK